ncbi:MAG: hypothetical protein HY270_15000 [Deltaproteobacteria bacterium]|nr:hypothetical protein [Deltaproteobacteria bacterium]
MKNVSVLCLIGLVALSFAGCGNDGEGSGSSTVSNGFVDEAQFQTRSLTYFQVATQSFSPGSPLNVISQIERSQRDTAFQVRPGSVPIDAWDGTFAKMAALQDTRDFDALYLLNVLLGYRDNPILAPGLAQKLEDALVAFKTWFTEPTPAGLSDDSYYWTENHEALYHTIEYLVGQTYPDRTLSTDGRSGREHLQTARARLLRWFDLRARFGFSEWHSNVYYQKDATPLLTLVEYANDEEIRTKAAAVLDVLLLDMATHTFRGAFGVTHGRSYKKDKMSSLDDDTWGMVKLLFDTTDYPYQGEDPGATLFARAKRYRLPEAIYRIARSPTAFVDKERMSLPLNELGPYKDNPQAPFGFSFTDPEDLTIWWGMGALTEWEVVPLTVQTFNQYNLWTTSNFAPFAGLKAFTGDLKFAQQFALNSAHMLGFALLEAVNTYTYRTSDYILSSAQDYRKGSFQAQVQSWQATLDANALVFTTHAFRPPIQTTNWYEDTETGSYWTGEASMPRSAQHENVAIHIYAPQYRMKNPAPFDFFHYEPYTHAYFPQDHFDEVVQEGSWTFGRLRDGYIALYSYRPAQWVVYDSTVYATNGMIKPFDLKADGGADNVWIVECGRAADWQSFERFRGAVAAANIVISARPAQGGSSGGYDVVYDSPSQGRVTFGWAAPLTVKGTEIAISDYPRHDSPWAQTPYNSPQASISAEGYSVQDDVEKPLRQVTGPR